MTPLENTSYNPFGKSQQSEASETLFKVLRDFQLGRCFGAAYTKNIWVTLLLKRTQNDKVLSIALCCSKIVPLQGGSNFVKNLDEEMMQAPDL